MTENTNDQEQAIELAAQRADYCARAKAIFPDDEAAAARLAQSMMDIASRGRVRNMVPECTSNYAGTQCRRPVCRCYPDRGTDRGGRERTLSR